MKTKIAHVIITMIMVFPIFILITYWIIVSDDYISLKSAHTKDQIYDSISTSNNIANTFLRGEMAKKEFQYLVKTGSIDIPLHDTSILYNGPYGRMIISQVCFSGNPIVEKMIKVNESLEIRRIYDVPDDSLHLLNHQLDSLCKELKKLSKQEVSIGFQRLQEIRARFLYYDSTLMEKSKKTNDTTISKLTVAVLSFAKTMKDFKIVYKKESNCTKALKENHLDCDLSGYLFIQLGNEVGLDLIGVNVTPPNSKRANHFVVASRTNEKITWYVETTSLLFGENPKLYNFGLVSPDNWKAQYKKCAFKYVEASDLK